MKSNASYSIFPERVKSALISNSKVTNNYICNKGHFDNYVGAGSIDVANTISNQLFQNTNLTPSSPIGAEVLSVNVYLNKNQSLNVGLASLSYISSGGNIAYTTDYDLRLYNSSNNLVSSSVLSSSSNVELIRYKAATSGSYRIVVYQAGTHSIYNPNDWISMTYNLS